MKRLIKSRSWLSQLIFKRIILILVILFCVGMGIFLASMNRLSTKLIESQALPSVKINAQIMRNARSLYTSEVVDRLQSSEIEVTHDYPGKPHAIPVPATYLIQLSHTVTAQNSGMSAHIYSRYPFPWRESEGRIKDKFQTEAIKYLEQYPYQTFSRIENVMGVPTLRYAEPDIMKPSCVKCHNSHPDSPKKDWLVGQVRGILEIDRSLDTFVSKTNSTLRGVSIVLGSLSLVALLGITVVIGRMRSLNKELDSLVKKRTLELNDTTMTLQKRTLELNDTTTVLVKTRQQVQDLRIQIDHKKRQKEVDEIVGSDSFDRIAQIGQKWRETNINQ